MQPHLLFNFVIYVAYVVSIGLGHQSMRDILSIHSIFVVVLFPKLFSMYLDTLLIECLL